MLIDYINVDNGFLFTTTKSYSTTSSSEVVVLEASTPAYKYYPVTDHNGTPFRRYSAQKFNVYAVVSLTAGSLYCRLKVSRDGVVKYTYQSETVDTAGSYQFAFLGVPYGVYSLEYHLASPSSTSSSPVTASFDLVSAGPYGAYLKALLFTIIHDGDTGADYMLNRSAYKAAAIFGMDPSDYTALATYASSIAEDCDQPAKLPMFKSGVIRAWSISTGPFIYLADGYYYNSYHYLSSPNNTWDFGSSRALGVGVQDNGILLPCKAGDTLSYLATISDSTTVLPNYYAAQLSVTSIARMVVDLIEVVD